MQTSFKKTIFIGAIFSLAAFGFVAGVDAAGPTALINPLQNTIDSNAPVQSFSALIINTLFGIAGSIALVMFVWGGILWLTAMGNSKQVDQGKQIFQWTTLGIIAMFASYTLVSFLFSSLGTAPVGSSSGGGSGGGSGSGSAAAGGSGSGSGAGGSAAGADKQYCCVDIGAFTANTVSSAGACKGSNKVAVAGSCDDMKFCGKPTGGTVTAANTCLPVLKAASCATGAISYETYSQCVLAENVKGAKKDYCCYNTKTKGSESTTVAGDASKACKLLGYETFAAGKCADIKNWCLVDLGSGGVAGTNDNCVVLSECTGINFPYTSYNSCMDGLKKNIK